MDGLVCADDTPLRLAVSSVPEPAPLPHEAVIRVAAVSLNRGELRRIETAPAGWRPGWDLAGVVHTPAEVGSLMMTPHLLDPVARVGIDIVSVLLVWWEIVAMWLVFEERDALLQARKAGA